MVNSLESYSEVHLFLGLLFRLYHVLAGIREEETANYDISSAEIGVLFVIQAIQLNSGKQATITDIAKYLVREVHTISELSSRMEKRGLIIKTKDETYRKRVKIAITEKGRQIFASSTRDESICSQILNTLSSDEKAALHKYLIKLFTGALKYHKSRLDPSLFTYLDKKNIYILGKLASG
ncbi:MAG: winged helix DNA-binding protein [Dehalococcoidales bacterium]|nr:winged helix DNA-binding protein [Dehalococcoidales bacterium]